MIPWQILKLEKSPRVKEGLYKTFYMLWYRTRFLNKTVRLKYLFDKRRYRLQYGAYCFLHLKKNKSGWTGFDYQTGNERSIKRQSFRSLYEPVYNMLRRKLMDKYGEPTDEEALTLRGTKLSRSQRWRSKEHFITLKAYTTKDGILDVSIYFSNRKKTAAISFIKSDEPLFTYFLFFTSILLQEIRSFFGFFSASTHYVQREPSPEVQLVLGT